ncbi:MAG: DUF4974 domain-containing protein [Gemmatimonadetes bacterium]|nr:DUF4974 domain-containing protein [Gemmatimonadota bacterium]
MVRVDGDHGGADIVAGQVAYLSTGSAPHVVDRGDVWSLLQWEAGLLVFQGTPLAEVAQELGRHFGRSVRVDASIEDRRVTAWFEDEPPEEVVAAVCLVVGARCEVGDSLVTMSGR